ncbi:helix-turn-helix domain-containing protein [Dendrosporobacter sp. 1207_IL3150]|uniref:helix-turn-helix domain-containing protein n=1 Tax=Dendrosporobacter sp. 1207_IL3150 TaxID=3084054 RepID=UPI002FDB82FE
MEKLDLSTLKRMTLGERIKYLRKIRGFHKRQDFVDAVNESSYQYLWEIELGNKSNIPKSLILRIAEVLNVPTKILEDGVRD